MPSYRQLEKNYDGFTRKEVEKAILARQAQGMMGSPSDDAFAAMPDGSAGKDSEKEAGKS
eukprot:CCRYP_000227-RA/>CCRYP_000227-RA protein AED:0.48 eAED:0.48 QI:0/0/0/1/1/1/2/0/59